MFGGPVKEFFRANQSLALKILEAMGHALNLQVCLYASIYLTSMTCSLLFVTEAQIKYIIGCSLVSLWLILRNTVCNGFEVQ